MTTTYNGLLSQGQSFSPNATPTAGVMAPAPIMKAATVAPSGSINTAQWFRPDDVTVDVSAPESRTYDGFALNQGYDKRVNDFTQTDGATVSGQLTGLLGSNSDYLKLNESKANIAANRRGLLSSSMAAGAGRAAAISAALPIAQQDAATIADLDARRYGYYTDTALGEQSAYNTSRLSAQDATQRSGELKQQFLNTSGLNNQQGQITANLSAQDATQNSSLQNAQGKINQILQLDNAKYSNILSAQNANQSAQLAKQQGMITSVLNNDQAKYAQALSAQNATQDSSLQSQKANEALKASEQTFIQNLGLAAQQFDFNRVLSDQNYRQQLGITEAQFQNSKDLAQQSFEHQVGLSDKEFEFNKTLQQMDQDSRAALQQMQNENAQLLQQSQSASNRFQDLSQQIATISTSPDMNPEQKAAAINQLMELSNKSLATQSALLKAAGIEGVELTSEGTTGVPDIEVPSSASDPQLQFNPSEYDAGNYEALQTEARRLSELANRLPANTPEGIAVRVSLKEIEIKELEIQYAATTSKNKHREINGVMARRQKELDALKQSLAALSPQSLPATPTVLHDDFKPETEYQKEDFSLAAKSISKQMLSALGR